MGDRGDRRAGVMSADQQAMAGVYAQALLDHNTLSAGENSTQPDSTQPERLCHLGTQPERLCHEDELENIVDLLDEIENGDELLALPLSVRARLDLVERIFHDRVSESMYALLAVMARRGRMVLLRAVAGEYRKLIEAKRGKIEVTVTTACELTEAQRQDLVTHLARTFGAEPILTARTDPGIIGGAIVQVGDKAYDASLASDLGRFARKLTHRVAARGTGF